MNPNQLYHESAKIIIKALTDSNGILHISELRKITKVEPNKLLENNVFAYHPSKNTITFQSKSIESYIQENSNMFTNITNTKKNI